jgi:hypothetical protein
MLLAASLIIGQGHTARAYDLPLLNLGATTFLDGLVVKPGLFVNDYVQYYETDRYTDRTGHRLNLPRQHLSAWANLLQLFWVSDAKIGPGRIALNLVAPVVLSLDTDDGLGRTALSGASGLGDVYIGVAYQFEPIMGPSGPSFAQRVELDAILPVGDYDRSRAINPGNNAFALNPSYAFTWFATPRLSISARLHYLYNFENGAPPFAFGTEVHEVQAGQVLHANLSLEYAVTEHLRLGVNGYALKQITDTRADGHALSGRREQVLAIGPGALVALDADTALFINGYVEGFAENRTEGFRLNIRWARRF